MRVRCRWVTGGRASILALGFTVAVLVPSAALAAVVNVVDSVGDVGRYASVVYGRDGLPIIAYRDETQTALKVAHCEDPACTTATITTLDNTADVGFGPGIMIGYDGLPFIAYRVSSAVVKTAHCQNVACTSASLSTVDSLFTIGVYGATGVTMGVDGFPVLVYGAPLKVAHCADVPCTVATVNWYTSSPGGLNSTVVIGSDGYPLIATGDSIAYTAHCENVVCTAATFTEIPEDMPGAEIWQPFIAKGTGAPVLAYTRFVGPQLVNHYTLLRRCADSACQTFDPPVVLVGGDGRWVYPVVGVRPGDLPLALSYLNADPLSRLVAKWCQDPACSTASTENVDAVKLVHRPSLAIGPSGEAFAAYYDSVNGNLKVALLTGATEVDLALSMTVAPDHGLPGDTVTYQLTVANLGGSPAATAVVTHPLPTAVELVSSSPACTYHGGTHVATCTVTGLPAGGSATLDLVVRLLPVAAGPYASTATVAAPGQTDPFPGNNTATATVTVDRWLAVDSPFVVEGHAGLTTLSFAVTLNDATPPGPPATVDYATSAGTATAGGDFLPVSGTLTFAPGALLRTVTVGVVGDLLPESAETFFLGLANAQGAGVVVSPGTGTIVDDDAAGLAGAELGHGARVETDLAGGPDLYTLAQSARASYEVVVDAAAGDVVPLALARIAADGSTVAQTGTPVGTGTGVSLRWAVTGALPVLTERIRVAGACASACDSGDVYRARAYETTAYLPRFNNVGTQTTVLLLQNPSDQPIAGTAWFWGASGTLVDSLPLSVPPRGMHVLNTSTLPLLAGVGGSVTITHDAPYGVLQGKSVAVEPASGFSFDTPLVYRPR